ncbi:MAG: hypothetical protein LQ342_007182 [Letrouitia transgressa]|nr:MAG: hypothetical protein LQ342_007182 [Letrouitia transgressa]
MSCSVPGKLGYNIAAAVLSFIVLLYFIFSTGPQIIFKTLPWFIWGQLALDAFMFIIWIAAAGASRYNYTDLYGWDCYYDYYKEKRNLSPAPQGLPRSVEKRDLYSSDYSRYGSHYRTGGKATANIGLDSIMVVLFAFTFAATVFWFVQNRNARRNAAAAGPNVPAGQTLNTGAPPMNPAVNNTYPQQPQPAVYPQGQPQPQGVHGTPGMQQPGFAQDKPVMQQTVYPQGQQGAGGEYYNQPQQQAQT